MPGISPIKILGHLKFMSHQLKLPTGKPGKGTKEGWTEKYFRDRHKAEMDGSLEHLPIPFFMPQKMLYKPQMETVTKIGKDFQKFHDDMLDAVQFSHQMWKLQAKFKDLQVMSMSAIGSPGCLDGPELESNIKNSPQGASMSGNMAKHRDAVAKGVSKCFKNWQDQVTVPGLPWYPAFVAFPGPMAPPMPNVPMPLICCISSKMSDIIMPDTMKKEMGDALDQSMKDGDPEKQYEALHDGIAMALSLAFLIWMASQQVMLVLGKGPIPSFAPPFVPVGPVVGGDNIAIPGHLIA